MERHRSGGITTIAALSIISGGLMILVGLFHVLGALALMREMSRLNVFELPTARLAFSLIALATGITGLIAGIATFTMRPWARALSLVYAGLLISSSILCFFTVPIIATIGSYDIGSLGANGLARLILFSTIYVAIPVLYAFVLLVAFDRPAWKAAFANSL